jgi:cysteinyl-tRNA synthetase
MHTGGQEHINIHHTNEIAQSEPIVGKPWVNYWVHFAWLMSKDGKMAKSEGDSLTVSYIKKLGYDPMHYRYMMLLGHYRQPMDFSFASLDAARAGYDRIVRKISELNPGTEADADKLKELKTKLLDPMNDNLKTAETLVALQEILRDKKIDDATKLAAAGFADELLGLRFLENARKLGDAAPVPDEIKSLADARARAKEAKNFALADQIRAELDAAGWMLTDTKDGFALSKK